VEAFIGLLGVVVGGLVTAGTAWLNAWRERRRAAVVAGRLVASELKNAREALDYPVSSGTWWSGDIDVSCWADHGPTLAAGLTRSEWHAVEFAYAEIAAADRTRRDNLDMPSLEDQQALLESLTAAMGRIDDGIQAAEKLERRLSRRLREPSAA
jgi:hypothetical protein